MEEKTKKENKEVANIKNYVVKKTTEYQLQRLDELKKKLPYYIKNRKKKFAEEYDKYMQEHCVDGVLIPDPNKIPMFDLIQHTFSPLIKIAGASPMYSADEFALAFDFYKGCAEQLNKEGVYAPKIEDFCSLINISRNTFNRYQTSSSDERLREVCNIIQDYCTARISDGAFSGNFEKVYSIFHQKSSNKQRDNDPVVNNTFVQNNTILNDEQYNELASKFLSNDE